MSTKAFKSEKIDAMKAKFEKALILNRIRAFLFV